MSLHKSSMALGLFALVFATAVMAAGKPDFSGTWKVNIAKSDFGEMPAPTSSVSKVEHKEPILKVNTTVVGGQGDFTFDATYSTDGKETTNKFLGDNVIKSVAKWDGPVLVIDSKGTFNGDEFTAKEKWTLSEDGKVLTRVANYQSAQGDGTQSQVAEKQ